MYKYGTLKALEVILRRRKEKGENNGGDESNQVHIYGRITKKPPLPLLYTKKNILKRK
jgi:hypothetical protein